MQNGQLNLFTDGGARGNPGPAGIGVVLLDVSGRTVEAYGKYIGENTNNQAEYLALISGLEKAVTLGVKKISCHLDSELIVRQLQGKYKIKNEGLKPLAAKVLMLSNKFLNVTYTYVPREKNHHADKLVNEAIDVQQGRSKV